MLPRDLLSKTSSFNLKPVGVILSSCLGVYVLVGNVYLLKASSRLNEVNNAWFVLFTLFGSLMYGMLLLSHVFFCFYEKFTFIFWRAKYLKPLKNYITCEWKYWNIVKYGILTTWYYTRINKFRCFKMLILLTLNN